MMVTVLSVVIFMIGIMIGVVGTLAYGNKLVEDINQYYPDVYSDLIDVFDDKGRVITSK